MAKLFFKGLFTRLLLASLLKVSLSRLAPVIQRKTKGHAIAEDFSFNTADGAGESSLRQFALPDNDDRPSLRLELLPNVLISLLVPCDLCSPKVCIRLWHRIELAVLVAVPEAAVDKDDRAVLGEDDVWFAGQPLVIHPVPEPKSPECLTQLQLRLRRSGVNGGHVAMTLGRSEYVGHYL